MPWRLIAKAFGWRAVTDEDGATPILVVWHPQLRRHFIGSEAWKRAVRLSSTRRNLIRSPPTEGRLSYEGLPCRRESPLQAHHRPESAIADALNGIPTPDMRKHAGNNSTLIDCGDRRQRHCIIRPRGLAPG